MNKIKTSDPETYKDIFTGLVTPDSESHKGQNGKVLVIGGSTLFHAASLWAAEITAYFADMVHYASTEENNEIFLSLKKKFHNGIVISRKELFNYAAEDDSILIGPGMVRDDTLKHEELVPREMVFDLQSEASFTHYITLHLLTDFPEKKFVLDAGALQMMDVEWLRKLKTKPVITPHQLEFERLFKTSIKEASLEEKIEIVKNKAKEYNCIILLKAIQDIVTDGEEVYVIEGGNAGLTKGGSGDILAGLTTALYAKNDGLRSAVMASVLLKKSADQLSETNSYWYNMSDVIQQIPRTMAKIVSP